MRRAHRQVLDLHADKQWSTRSLRNCQEAAFAWDEAHQALRDGAPRIRTLAVLAREVASPARAVGIVTLLAGRFRGRRLAARYARDGRPSVAILRGAPNDRETPDAVIDLRDRTVLGGLVYLLRRPAARALVGGRFAALAARAVGVEPIGTAKSSH